MSKPSLSIRLAAIAGMLTVLTPGANANQCGDMSPLFQELGEQYYELDNHHGSAASEKALEPNRLIRTLQSERFRSGLGQRTQCYDASADKQRVNTLTLEDIETGRLNSHNEIVLKAFEYDKKTRTARPASVFIPLSSQTTALDGEQGLVVNSRHRQSIQPGFGNNPSDSGSDTDSDNGNEDEPDEGDQRATEYVSGSQLREISMSVNGSQNTVEITQLLYVNGYLAEWFTWTLDTARR